MQWKGNRLTLGAALMVGLTTVGCGGFSASPSISPATFLMPGFMQLQPTEPRSPGQPEPTTTDLQPAAPIS